MLLGHRWWLPPQSWCWDPPRRRCWAVIYIPHPSLSENRSWGRSRDGQYWRPAKCGVHFVRTDICFTSKLPQVYEKHFRIHPTGTSPVGPQRTKAQITNFEEPDWNVMLLAMNIYESQDVYRLTHCFWGYAQTHRVCCHKDIFQQYLLCSWLYISVEVFGFHCFLLWRPI